MKIAFISNSVSRRSAGVFEVERNLAFELLDKSIELKVYGLHDNRTEQDLHLWQPIVPSLFHIRGPFKFGYAPGYFDDLVNFSPDVAHIHSIWKYPSYITYKWSTKYKKPYVTTLNGMLDRWAVENSKYKKKFILKLFEKKALDSAACIQVNTEKEYIDARHFGLKNPICIINNGVKLKNYRLNDYTSPWPNITKKGKKVLLFLGRIHPKKNPQLLVKAWHSLVLENFKGIDEWQLVMVGFSNIYSHEAEIKKTVIEKNLTDKIVLLDAQYGDAMNACFCYSDAFILPSSSEGVPISVLEAWTFKLPTLITEECNLIESFSKGAAIKIEPNIDSIKNGIRHVISLHDDQRKILSENAFSLVQSDFLWPKIADKLVDIYKWVSGSGPMPETVVKDKFANKNCDYS